MEVFEISANWLLNYGFESRESALARTIFSHLNWNFDKNTGELFLPFEIHVRMASLIVDVSTKLAPETIGSSGISESVRQMSNLVKGQTPQQQFTMWCWNMVSVLRLHSFDQNTEFVRRTIRNPADALRYVNELERLPSIAQGVTENRPIAVYISILTTMWGHSVPQICHKGFAQMQNLLNDYRYSTVIRCLQLITPFFLDCPESLCKCAAFQSILTSILQADRTYIRMAKDFISCDYPGPVVELFSNMIQAQIIDYFQFDLQTPVMLITLWLDCMTVNPVWYKDPNSLYVVDVILRVAYQFTDAWITAKNFFKFFCKVKSTRINFIFIWFVSQFHFVCCNFFSHGDRFITNLNRVYHQRSYRFWVDLNQMDSLRCIQQQHHGWHYWLSKLNMKCSNRKQNFGPKLSANYMQLNRNSRSIQL